MSAQPRKRPRASGRGERQGYHKWTREEVLWLLASIAQYVSLFGMPKAISKKKPAKNDEVDEVEEEEGDEKEPKKNKSNSDDKITAGDKQWQKIVSMSEPLARAVTAKQCYTKYIKLRDKEQPAACSSALQQLHTKHVPAAASAFVQRTSPHLTGASRDLEVQRVTEQFTSQVVMTAVRPAKIHLMINNDTPPELSNAVEHVLKSTCVTEISLQEITTKLAEITSIASRGPRSSPVDDDEDEVVEDVGVVAVPPVPQSRPPRSPSVAQSAPRSPSPSSSSVSSTSRSPRSATPSKPENRMQKRANEEKIYRQQILEAITRSSESMAKVAAQATQSLCTKYPTPQSFFTKWNVSVDMVGPLLTSRHITTSIDLYNLEEGDLIEAGCAPRKARAMLAELDEFSKRGLV